MIDEMENQARVVSLGPPVGPFDQSRSRDHDRGTAQQGQTFLLEPGYSCRMFGFLYRPNSSSTNARASSEQGRLSGFFDQVDRRNSQ